MPYNTDKGKFYALDAPQLEGKDGYVGTFYALILRLGAMAGDPNLKDTDNRIKNMVNIMISLIPGKKKRETIRKELNEEVDRRVKGITSNEDRARIRNDVCIEMLGTVTDYIDLHVALDTENRIGYCMDDADKIIIQEHEDDILGSKTS